MKKLSILLAIIMLVGLFSSCDGIGDDLPENGGEGQTFDFSHEIEKREYLRGEEIRIKAIVKNISGRTLKYTGCSSYDYFPNIELYWLTSDGEVGGTIGYDPMVFLTDVVTKTVKKGEVGSYTYSFIIPNDAECTDYSIRLYFGDDSRVFENVLKISAETSQDEDEKYQYCTTSVISGGAEINPIEVYIGYSEYKNNELVDVVEIAGYEYIFSSDMYDVTEFPTLVLNGEVSARPPVNVRIYGVAIYDTDYNRLKYSFDSLYELDELPAGEYVIIYYEEADGRGCEPEIKDFRINKSVGVFKFVVPEETVPAFSFAEESERYKQNDPGVKYIGFRNTAETRISNQSDAVERAKNECTVQYDTAAVSFDFDEKVWKIVFYTQGVAGGGQTVYLDENGVTLLIVYGE